MMRRWFCCLSVVLIATWLLGCGGESKPKTVPLATQFQNALKESNADFRAKRLVNIAFQQRKAGDTAGESGSLNEALRSVREITEPPARASVMVTVADALAQSGRNSDAETLIKDVEKSSDQIEDAVVKLEVLTRMAEVKGRYLNEADIAKKHLTDCEKMLASFADPKDKTVAMLQVALAHFRIQDVAEADRLIASATETARGCEDLRKQADSLAELADTLNKMSKTEAAKTTFAEAQQVALKIEDAYSRTHALKGLADRHLRLGQKDEARGLLDKADLSVTKVGDMSLRAPLQEELDKMRRRL